MHLLKTPSLIILALAALSVGYSCSGELDGSGNSLVNIRLIDAPGDFDEAWVEIRGVEILQGRSRESTGANWLYLEYQQPNQQVDISKLVGGGILLLGRAEIPDGTISKIKLVLGEDHYLVRNGRRISLTLDARESEIELDVNYELENSFSYDVYLDFDLGRSVKSTSDSTRFILSPTVRSFVRYQTSEIGGTIRQEDAWPVIYAIQGKDTLSTLTNARGDYTFMGLKEGKHTVLIQPRPPYMDTVFQAETELGKITAIEQITLRIRP